jgi:hypothetical protein
LCRWILVLAVSRVTAEVLKAVTKLQGYATLLSEQSAVLSELSHRLCELAPVEGPFSEEQLVSLDIDDYVVNGRYAASLHGARQFIDDLGSFVLSELQEIEDADVAVVTQSVAQLFVDLVAGIADVCAERDSNNLASTQLLPAVTPQGLVKMRGSEFGAIMLRIKPRMQRNGFEQREMERIEAEFAELLAACRSVPPLKESIGCRSDKAQFKESWSPLDHRFPLLQEFCGGIASAFPNTARVEADFSTIKREKNLLRMSLSDFSLEGILHASQFDAVQALQ